MQKGSTIRFFNIISQFSKSYLHKETSLFTKKALGVAVTCNGKNIVRHVYESRYISASASILG